MKLDCISDIATMRNEPKIDLEDFLFFFRKDNVGFYIIIQHQAQHIFFQKQNYMLFLIQKNILCHCIKCLNNLLSKTG